MRAKNLLLFLISGCLIFFTGCGGTAQINQKLVVQGIAIDLDESDYIVTVQALDFKNPEGKDEPAVKVIQLKGKTLSEALESIFKKSGLIPLYSQNVIVIIGENAAKYGVSNFMDFFIRYYEARPNVKVCVAKSNASDILSQETGGNPIKVSSIDDLIPQNFNSDILHFTGRLNSETSDPYCAYLEFDGDSDKKTVAIKGIAIFSKDKMVSTLENDDFFGALQILGIKPEGGYNIYTDNIGKVSLNINKIKSKIKFDESDGNGKFTINMDISANVLETVLSQGVKINENEQYKIEKQFASEIIGICKQTVHKSVSLDSDIFRFGKIIMNNNTQYFREISNSLKEKLKTFNYEFVVKVNIELTGTEI